MVERDGLSLDKVRRAQDYLEEIQPWYWEFGFAVGNFYREVEKKMQERNIKIALLLGDVRCGKTVERVKWQAREPERVAGYNLEGHGSSRNPEIIRDILASVGGRKPEVLILDEVGYVENPPDLIAGLARDLPKTKIMLVLPVRLDEGQEVAQELATFVESEKGLVREFPATWPKEVILNYFRRRCELEGISFAQEFRDQVASVIHYLSLGIPKSVDLATSQLLVFLKTREETSPEKLAATLKLGLGYYINPDRERELSSEVIEAARCFTQISSTLYELVLKQMPGQRFQKREEQQKRLGVYYMLEPLFRTLGVPEPDFKAEPILPPSVEGAKIKVDIEGIVRKISRCRELGQSVYLMGVSLEEREQIIGRLVDEIKAPVIRINLAQILTLESSQQTKAFCSQVAESLNVPEMDSFLEVRRMIREKQVALIIGEGIEECKSKGFIMGSTINGLLRSTTNYCPWLALGDLPKVRFETVGSPFFNVFTPVEAQFFRK